MLRKIILATLLVLTISGCASNSEQPIYTDNQIQAQKTAINQAMLLQELNPYIVKLPSEQNELMVLALPKDQLFNPDSANFTQNARPLLYNIAQLISFYDKGDIKVINNHTFPYSIRAKNSNEAFAISKALTAKQSSKVMQYLWDHNINGQIIYAQSRSNYAIQRILMTLRANNSWYKHREAKYILIVFKKLVY